MPTSKFSPRRNPYAHIKRSEGKRSGLEVQVAAQLSTCGMEFREEKNIEAIEFTNPTVHKYHPDFLLANGIIIETKGWFKTADRTKHLTIKHQHPDKDIRFVFSNPNKKIGKKSKTTYAMWCQKNGFQFAKETVPQTWLEEKKPRKKPHVLIWDKKDFPPSCSHKETFMKYEPGDEGYFIVCWSCGAVIDGGMAGHN